MPTNKTRLYGAIEKSEKQDDGTIKVWGYASAECVDSDGEVITAEAMQGARDGYMAFANVREMHDPKKAAGVAIDYEVQDDGRTWFGAHVVDPVAVLKVETGVYKGFSIGAKVPKGGREGKVIKAIELREVSLVDRPSNPEAVFTLVKADGSDEEGEGDEIKKGLYELREFADVLRGIGYLVSSSGWEAQSEGDNSPLPAAMLAWLATGVDLFQSMAAEETAEMLASLKAAMPTQPADLIAASADGGDLTKAGKKFSAATKTALKAAHDACKAADKALADLGYDGEDAEEEGGGDEAGKAAVADDLVKRHADEAAAVEEIAKASGLTIEAPSKDELMKAALSELLKVRKDLAEMQARPAPAKGYANAHAISKAADRGDGQEQELEPVVKADGSKDEVATLVKAAQLRPIAIT